MQHWRAGEHMCMKQDCSEVWVLHLNFPNSLVSKTLWEKMEFQSEMNSWTWFTTRDSHWSFWTVTQLIRRFWRKKTLRVWEQNFWKWANWRRGNSMLRYHSTKSKGRLWISPFPFSPQCSCSSCTHWLLIRWGFSWVGEFFCVWEEWSWYQAFFLSFTLFGNTESKCSSKINCL